MPDPVVFPFAPLLRIPPFPGSRPLPMVRLVTEPIPTSDAEIDQAIDAMARARVGGDYWACQPQLPEAPYTLVSVGGRAARDRLLRTIERERPVICWVRAASEVRPSDPSTIFVSGSCDPWHLVGGAAAVFADPGSDLALVAALSGMSVTHPDEFSSSAAGDAKHAPRDTIRDHLVGPIAYADPFTGDEMSLLRAVELCASWRALIDGNRTITAAIGFAAWKRSTVAPLLWAGTGDVPFATRPPVVAKGDRIVAWKSKVASSTLTALEDQGAELIEVEDGFIRSIGLGADCVPPLSLVVDRRGIFFDPGRPSDLEELLQNGSFSAELLNRAQRLRKLVVDTGVSKYDVGQHAVERRGAGRRTLLVPGQVEDDRSVVSGGGAVSTNIELLRRVRDAAPEAYVLYKPHPDVEAGHRVGAMTAEQAAQHADEVVRNQPITPLIDMVDEVHVNTSLAGFEALLRGKPVTTHGVPFYAGWGLTRDLGEVPQRRTAKRSLNELVAAVLLLYPRYLDPVTGLPCTPEILIRRLADGSGARNAGPLVPLRRLQGYVNRRLASLRGSAGR